VGEYVRKVKANLSMFCWNADNMDHVSFIINSYCCWSVLSRNIHQSQPVRCVQTCIHTWKELVKCKRRTKSH